ncbi:MAG: hypothetical protein ABIJ46_04885 [bacterium]
MTATNRKRIDSLLRRLSVMTAVVFLAVMPLAALALPPADEAAPPANDQYRPSVGLEATATSPTGHESGIDRIGGLGALTGTVLGRAIGLVGVIFFVLMIYAGVLWMTARGNDEQVQKARSIMTGAVIGMFIVFAAYYILDFVLGAIYQGFGADTGGE